MVSLDLAREQFASEEARGAELEKSLAALRSDFAATLEPFRLREAELLKTISEKERLLKTSQDQRLTEAAEFGDYRVNSPSFAANLLCTNTLLHLLMKDSSNCLQSLSENEVYFANKCTSSCNKLRRLASKKCRI